MDNNSKIFVAGHNGLVGSAIVRNLKSKGYNNIITANRKQLDLTDQCQVDLFFIENKPDYVFLAAAKVGGIVANRDYPADFIRDNLLIQTNVIDASYRYDVKKMVFLGSSCIYPKHPTIPITEDQLLTGPLEPTNDAYAVAKIAGIKMCQAYNKQYGFNAVSLMPTNLYGPNDNFDPESSHVIPGIMGRVHNAKINNEPFIECWGDGSALREFLFIDDFAEACYTCMIKYNNPEIINIGSGKDITIKNLTELICNVLDYTGEIKWDISKPNGTPRKVMNVDKIKSLGWDTKTGIRQGLYETYEWFKNNVNDRI
jgi:GDP-L-fucose synthase